MTRIRVKPASSASRRISGSDTLFEHALLPHAELRERVAGVARAGLREHGAPAGHQNPVHLAQDGGA